MIHIKTSIMNVAANAALHYLKAPTTIKKQTLKNSGEDRHVLVVCHLAGITEKRAPKTAYVRMDLEHGNGWLCYGNFTLAFAMADHDYHKNA